MKFCGKQLPNWKNVPEPLDTFYFSSGMYPLENSMSRTFDILAREFCLSKLSLSDRVRSRTSVFKITSDANHAVPISLSVKTSCTLCGQVLIEIF